MAAAQGCGADGLAELRIADTRAFQGVVVRRSGVIALVIRADYAPEHVASAKGQCQRYSAEQDANADSHVTTITAVGKCQLAISSPGSRRLERRRRIALAGAFPGGAGNVPRRISYRRYEPQAVVHQRRISQP